MNASAVAEETILSPKNEYNKTHLFQYATRTMASNERQY